MKSLLTLEMQPSAFLAYKEYLKTPLWRRISRRVLKRDNQMCWRCGQKATQVHHLSYTVEVMAGDNDSQLVSLCGRCHRTVERDNCGNKRTQAEKDNILRGIEDEEQARIKYDSGGICFWCGGDSEIPVWGPSGRVYDAPATHGWIKKVWMCCVCCSTLDWDKDGHSRSLEEKAQLLKKRATRSYRRRKPSVSFHFNDGFRRLNAIQRQLMKKDFDHNCNIIHGRSTSTEID